MISASGEKDHALLLDCRSWRPASSRCRVIWRVLIVNSNVRRGLVDSEYNTRRQQCEAAARHYGVKGCCATRSQPRWGSRQGRAGRGELSPRPPRGRRERPHLAAADALESGDLARLGELMGCVPRRHAR